MSKKSVLILIPARFASTRFPGKPLALIDGKTMISRVLENCLNAFDPEIHFESYVVTDSPEIERSFTSTPINVIRIDDDVISGTLRIELAYKRFFADREFDLVINVQGDEPLLEGRELVSLAKFHLESHFSIATLVKKYAGFTDGFFDSNKVKVALSELTKQAFYFSRASIPFKRDSGSSIDADYWFHHIGVYSYRPDALEKFAHSPVSRLEDLEKLEQLRALEIGLTIGAIETNCHVIGVDHPEDIKKVEEVIRGRK